MRWLACALLLGVCIRHFSNHWFNSYLGVKWWFYVMGGLWEALLCSVLAAVVWQAKETKWRWAALYALMIGISEALQMAICRVLIFDISKMPIGTNTCDFVTGLQMTATINTLYLLIGALLLGVMWREYKRG